MHEAKTLSEKLRPILTAMRNHVLAGPFQKPVTLTEAPGYHDIIALPIGKSVLIGKIFIYPKIN